MAKKSSSGTPLKAVKGVGPARVKKLKKAGIKSAEGIAAHNPETIAEKAGISKGAAENIVKAAKKASGKSTKKTKKSSKKSSKSKKTASKKSTKKKSTKKSSKRSSSRKKKAAQDKAAKAAATAMRDIIARARDHFRKAPEEHAFYLRDGRRLRDIKELADAMEDMHEHVFNHHVNDDRHDFANWVHEVLQERALAEQLREAQRDPDKHQYVIYRHIVRRVW